MRLLVLSDSHGNTYNLRQAILAHPEADRIIFLGDGERDIDAVTDEIGRRPLTVVRGNCDSSFSMLPEMDLIEIDGHTVYCTHGYVERVKYGPGLLLEKAERLGADIILYGHTHYQEADYDDGVYIMNPGSINEYEYGIVDVTKDGIMLNTARLK